MACTFSTSQLPKVARTPVFLTFWLRNVLRATTACTFSTSQLPKVVQTWCVLYILTSKCASGHSSVHFFDISTSKSGPNMVCFVHFDFEMCFAPQRRALFPHLNFQKWSEHGVLCAFWLVCASRHNGVHFSISHLASWLRTRRFSEPTFQPSGASNHWKNTEFRDFPTFSRTCIFFLLTLSLLWSSLCCSSLLFSSLTLTTSAFHLSTLSEVWLLNFLRISYIPMNTNSTAQGGGGSFKNRKPIGEVGCCYSRMAERIHGWTERWLISLTLSHSFSLFCSLSLSFSLFLSLSLSFSNYLPTYLPIYLSIDLSISLSSVYLTIYLSIHLSSYLSIYPSIYLSIYPSILSIHLSI